MLGRSGFRRHRERASPRLSRAGFEVESLEGRTSLSLLGSPRAPRIAVDVAGMMTRAGRRHPHRHPTLGIPSAGSVVSLAPRFYAFYTGPRRPDLLATAATAEIVGKNLVLSGRVEGPIDVAPTEASQGVDYVFGIDRGGAPDKGLFPGREQIRFDSTVTIAIRHGGITGQISLVDRGTIKPSITDLPSTSIGIAGDTVSVTVPLSQLHSDGKAINQYRVTFWPRVTEPPGYHSVASFVPAGTNFRAVLYEP